MPYCFVPIHSFIHVCHDYVTHDDDDNPQFTTHAKGNSSDGRNERDGKDFGPKGPESMTSNGKRRRDSEDLITFGSMIERSSICI